MSAARASRTAAGQRQAEQRRRRLRAVDRAPVLLSAPAMTGCRPDARQRRGTRLAPAPSCQASPSPMSTSPRCASGARSPLAPTDPRDGTTGCTRRLSSAMQQLQRLDANPGESFRQHVGAQRHRRADDRHRQRIADAGGVAAQEIHLQLGERVVRDPHVGEVAEPGVDAVRRRVVVGGPRQRRRAPRERDRAPHR